MASYFLLRLGEPVSCRRDSGQHGDSTGVIPITAANWHIRFHSLTRKIEQLLANISLESSTLLEDYVGNGKCLHPVTLHAEFFERVPVFSPFSKISESVPCISDTNEGGTLEFLCIVGADPVYPSVGPQRRGSPCFLIYRLFPEIAFSGVETDHAKSLQNTWGAGRRRGYEPEQLAAAVRNVRTALTGSWFIGLIKISRSSESKRIRSRVDYSGSDSESGLRQP